MRKTFLVARRILIVLVLIPVGAAGLVNFFLVSTLAGDWVHQKRYVENYTYDPDRLHAPEALREDFAIFRGALEESHGGLYWYTPEEKLDTAFDAAAAKLDKPMTELEFVRVIAPLVDLIRDGHTQLRLPPYDTGFIDASSKALWPLDVVSTEAGTYVEDDGSSENVLAPGSEILAVNGRPINQLEDEMLALFRTADGYAHRSKIRALYSRDFFASRLGYLENFPETYEVTYLEPNGVQKKTTLGALPFNESGRNMIERNPDAKVPDTTAGVLLTWNGDIPVLEIPSFFEGWYDDYANALESAFAEVKRRGAQTLVIDLRENGGGFVSRDNLLFTHLHPEAYQKLAEYSTPALGSSYLSYAKTPWRKRWQNFLLMLASDTPETEGSFVHDPKTNRWWRTTSTYSSRYDIGRGPTSDPFTGQVYLLLSGDVLSSAAEFATMAKEQLPNVVIVGQETRGAYQGGVAGFIYELILPNSHLGLTLPRVKYRLAVEGDNPPHRGVLPDHEVWQTHANSEKI